MSFIDSNLCLKKQFLGPLLLRNICTEDWYSKQLKRKIIHRIAGISMQLNGEKFQNSDEIIWILSFSSFFLKHELQNWLQNNVSTTIRITQSGYKCRFSNQPQIYWIIILENITQKLIFKASSSSNGIPNCKWGLINLKATTMDVNKVLLKCCSYLPS